MLWDNFKPPHIWIIGVPKGERVDDKKKKKFKEVIAKTFLM